MAIDPIGAVGAPAPVTGVRAAAPAPVAGPSFAAALQQQLEQPRAEVAQVRAEVASLRDGGVLRRPGAFATVLAGGPPGGASAVPTNVAALLAQQATGDVSDPYGWRQMSRQIGDQVIGPGYGALFERQIQQESGFAPDVVYGARRSTAGAEGIAQLMPQYYPGVSRADPRQGLLAGAQTMQQYLGVWNGDVRRALASYNAGLGRVQAVIAAHGNAWESALPAETRQYLNAILGDARPVFRLSTSPGVAVFGGRGPGGVLTPPLDQVTERSTAGGLLALGGAPGATVRAPADGSVVRVADFDGVRQLTIDHGNGWQTTLDGLAGVLVAPGAAVRRSDPLGVLAGLEGDAGVLRLGVWLNGQARDPTAYLLGG